jgi:hypothetical protein
MLTPDDSHKTPDRRQCQHDERIHGSVTMAIALIFILGIVNFALHKAVMESGHPLLGQMPWFVQTMGGRLTMATEFMVLLAAMILVANGWPGLVWAYFLYSGLNALAAWLIFSDRL